MNGHLMRKIVQAIVFICKQGIAFHGKLEAITSSKHLGNFSALQNFLRPIAIFIIAGQRMQHTYLQGLKMTL